jgi:hypothetical protein
MVNQFFNETMNLVAADLEILPNNKYKNPIQEFK